MTSEAGIPPVKADMAHTAVVPRRDGSPATVMGAAVDAAERRVVRQLVEAILFEGLVEHEAEPRDTTRTPLDPIYDLDVTFALGHQRYQCVAAITAFSRVRVAEGSALCVDGDTTREARLVDLVASFDVDAPSKRRLLDELTQTVELCRWNREHLQHQKRPRRGLSFQALESAIVEGHQYHPCFKTRTGFTQADHEAYGSEVGAAFALEWLAVARASMRIALPTDEATFFTKELGEHDYAALLGRLARHGGDLETYALVPVHPWHLRALDLDEAIGARTIITLGTAGDRYRASQSLRTLVNASHPEKANVKLPLDVVCTSSHRNFEPHFVCTAPTLSAWLASIVRDDPFLRSTQRLLILEEYAAMVHEPPTDDARAGLEGRIGVIFRESVCAKLAHGEAAVPFTALTVIESDGRPFIADWVHAHGAERFIARLVEVVLIPIWHMLVHHGIAFEAHAQNLILVHRDGIPEKIVLRDFHEDTEFVPAFLRAPDAAPDFSAVDPFFETIPDDDGYRMAEVEALRELFMDTVYVYNLADVAFVFARFFDVGEARFFEIVREGLGGYARSGVTEEARILRLGCDDEEIVVESLLKKKLLDGGVLEYFEHRVRNTLID